MRESKIRYLAYCLWKDAGEPEGNPDVFWYEAENILRKQETKKELYSIPNLSWWEFHRRRFWLKIGRCPDCHMLAPLEGDYRKCPACQIKWVVVGFNVFKS